MPKAKGPKWYAVLIGRDGPQVYGDWEECKVKVTRYPGAVHKSFKTRHDAEVWLGEQSTKASQSPYFNPRGSDYQTKEKSESTKPVAKVAMNQAQGEIILSPEQRQVLDRVKAGQNVFFTGSAGTGKSVLLREIISFCGGASSSQLAITASTGIASVNIGGCTLHSWAGIGLGNETAKQFVGKFFGQPKFNPVLERWQKVKTLIIDEISMLDGRLFDTLEGIARGTRRSDLPFGGIQLVLCGDFCQLPPVTGRDPKTQKEIPVKFAFEAESWATCVPSLMHLTRVFRQKDQAFVDMLNEMRFGKMKPSTVQAFKSLSRKVTYTDGIEPTELYSTRKEVDSANRTRLAQIESEERVFVAQDIPGRDVDGRRTSPQKMGQLLERLLCPPTLTLKVGAQVMLVKNLQQGKLVNGSVGQVIGFMTAADAAGQRMPVAEADQGPSPLPAQGSSRDTPIEIDDSEDEGPIDAIAEEIAQAASNAPLMLWPLVRFIGGLERLIVPADFTVNNADGAVEARRIQLPLILAWAMSCHKSQGQTLQRVKVDLRRTFEKGQAYVALSRATTMDQLQVLNFEASKVMVHPRVLAWYGQKAPSGDNQYDYEDFEFDEMDEMDNDEAMAAYYDV